MDNSLKNSALSILDYLYFFDVAAQQRATEERYNLYLNISKEIDIIASNRNYEPVQVEIYKHLLLCYLEVDSEARIKLSLLKLKCIANYEIRSKLSILVEKHKFPLDEFNSDLATLKTKYQKALNPSLSYKLVSQILYVDYDSSSIIFLIKNIRIGSIKTTKFRNKKIEDYQDYFEFGFLRSMLFVEFELLKKQVYLKNNITSFDISISESSSDVDKRKFREKIEKILSYNSEPSYSIGHIDLSDSTKIKSYIMDIGVGLGHENFLSDNVAKWIGIIAAWFVYDYLITYENKKIYSGDEGEGDFSAVASETLSNFGFTINKRTIYNHFKKIFYYYSTILSTHHDLNITASVEIKGLDLIDLFGYVPNKSDEFLKKLEIVKQKWKEND